MLPQGMAPVLAYRAAAPLLLRVLRVERIPVDVHE